jgi:exonuclease III
MLVPRFASSYAFLPAALLLRMIFFMLSNVHTTTHIISATITMRSEWVAWSLTCVYGPQGEPYKVAFIEELKLLQPFARQEWLLLGDFNLITRASDKNNTNINRRLIGKFRRARNHLHLEDIRLTGLRFTWSNDQQNTILTRIDHMFCTDDWDILFPDAHLQAISSRSSDHSPLILQGDASTPQKPSFKFEEFWLRIPGFAETIALT